MYATITLFTTKPGMREQMEKLGDAMFNALRGMKGFKNLTLIADYNPLGVKGGWRGCFRSNWSQTTRSTN